MSDQPADAAPALAPGAGVSRLFAPRSIAIIGASDRPGSFGLRTRESLAPFTGEVFLVNARRDEIGGQRCYRSIADVPGPVDCAILATPQPTIEGLVDECIAAGVGGALIYASGFAEVGTPELVEQQARIAARARRAGMRLIGPNAIGFVNFDLRLGATFMSDLHLDLGYSAPARARSIGLVSQSGALGLALTQGMVTGHFFSHALTCGNSADVDVADCIAWLAHDPTCRVIACNFEGHADPRRVRDAALIASDAGKPLVIYKMATGAGGAVAAASHTGSLAGSHEAYRTMFENAGAVMVDEYDALLDTAAFFAKARPNNGRGMAVVATSGGAAIMAADAAEKNGVPLPQPTPALRARLAARVPDFGSTDNPCDVTAQVMNDMASLTDCAEGFIEAGEYGAFLIPHLFAYESSLPRIPVLDALAAEHGKVICTVWLSAWLEGPGHRELTDAPNTVLFRSMDHCFAAFAAWRRWLDRGRLTADAPRSAPDGAREAVAGTLGAADGATLGEREAKPVLAAYGIGVVPERMAADATAARAAAEEIGFPVAMKLDAANLAHKTEAGGVALNLIDGDGVEAAFEAMMERASTLNPPPDIRGVLIQKMAAKGVEIVIGGRADPVFGPMVVAGIGGVLVEVLRDTIVAPAPVTPAQAARMLDRLRYSSMLDGVRDLPAVDRDALALAVARVSELLADFPDLIAELDVNPVICRGSEITAVDGLIIKRDTDKRAAIGHGGGHEPA